MLETIKNGAILFAITVISAALLIGVNALTKNVTAENGEKETRINLTKILPQSVNFSEDIKTGAETGVVLYNEGYGENGEVCGYVFTVMVNGYSGAFPIYVGVEDGLVTNVEIGENNEMPGLGKNVESKKFTDKFIGKGMSLTVVKGKSSSDSQIQAVTSATKTSKEVVGGVNRATEYYNFYLKGKQVAE